jgi:hypothetical protein
MVYLPFVVALLAFSLYHYSKLKKQYLTDQDVKRVIDPGKFLETAIMAGVAGVALYLMLSKAYEISFLLAIPVAVLALWLANWIGKMQARVFLGVVIDYNQDVVIFEPDISSFDIVDYLKVTPYLRSLTEMEQVQLADIQKITRQAGRNLYMHGDFGSRKISFTNKQKRDECIHFLTSGGRSRAKLVVEME